MPTARPRPMPSRRRGSRLAVPAMAALLLTALAGAPRADTRLATFTVAASDTGTAFVTDASVEAVRDAKVASQVAGRIVELPVSAGDHVRAGQVLARIDTTVVAQQLASSQAQVAQAQAQAAVARTELERARQLFQQDYLSQAALDQAQARARAAEAVVKALQAQTGGIAAQAAWHVVRAPFTGWVAQVAVSQGDAASPGQPLMTVYDPTALRVSAQVPESVGQRLDTTQAVALDIGGRHVALSAHAQLLPAIDPGSRTVTVRVPLPATLEGPQPGQAARLGLPLLRRAGGDTGPQPLWVPSQAVVRRGELSAVYVVPPQGTPRLRQVRLGRDSGTRTDILAGLDVGERVALDPTTAARASRP